MEPRSLTQREQAVLVALLAVDFAGVENLRRQAPEARVVGVCGCGCPSVDFQQDLGRGMTIQVDAGVRDGSDGLFLYTVEDARRGELLGGIEWVGAEDEHPDEFPPPELLDVRPA
ncbi:hypothetical protein EDD30_0378 [Couchioplanes caeruleus]|uniref:Uncharacterized protein n=3 Tax=Couchioplanes caeruleus TaxID=56438 RepID=A0A1K0FAX9_9ACTN|nr:hypothetical protein BG844_35125 [Couchioplanes caeruleus subsp. caeruleus]ROP27688.1 hypothetical protein EDD30_0378 [Couchioplanes caeruleus]